MRGTGREGVVGPGDAPPGARWAAMEPALLWLASHPSRIARSGAVAHGVVDILNDVEARGCRTAPPDGKNKAPAGRGLADLAERGSAEPAFNHVRLHSMMPQSGCDS